MELSQRVDDGKVPFSGEGRECKDRDAHRNVFGELGEAAEGAAHRRGLGGVHHYRQWHADYNHQQISQGQREDVTGNEFN